MKKLLLLISLISLASCTNEIITEESSFDNTTTTITPKMFKGKYRITYKEFIDQDGGIKKFFPVGSVDPNPEVDGWISESTLTFTNDSLIIAQLMNDGWDEGSVLLKWENGIPKRVGCRWVESANETQISWYQDDIIIKNHLEKL